MLPSMPIISFGPQGPNFEQLRREEPILFLSIIAAAASITQQSDLFEKLQKEAVSIITYNAVVEGQKTSELLLSLLVLTFWPIAPSRYLPAHAVTHMQSFDDFFASFGLGSLEVLMADSIS